MGLHVGPYYSQLLCTHTNRHKQTQTDNSHGSNEVSIETGTNIILAKEWVRLSVKGQYEGGGGGGGERGGGRDIAMRISQTGSNYVIHKLKLKVPTKHSL